MIRISSSQEASSVEPIFRCRTFVQVWSIVFTVSLFTFIQLIMIDTTSNQLKLRHTPNDLIAFQNSSQVSSLGYIMYFNYGRYSNNLVQLRRMLSLARRLQRKLLVPPLGPVRGEYVARGVNWLQFYDLQHLNRLVHPRNESCRVYTDLNKAATVKAHEQLIAPLIGRQNESWHRLAEEYSNPEMWTDDCWVLPWAFSDTNHTLKRIKKVWCIDDDYDCQSRSGMIFDRPTAWNTDELIPPPYSLKKIKIVRAENLLEDERLIADAREANTTIHGEQYVVLSGRTSYWMPVPKTMPKPILMVTQTIKNISMQILQRLPRRSNLTRPNDPAENCVSAHIRLGDMVGWLAPSIDKYINKISDELERTNASRLFVCTDADTREQSMLQEKFPFIQIGCGLLDKPYHEWCNREDLAVVIEQQVASMCAVFIGAYESTFSREIVHQQSQHGLKNPQSILLRPSDEFQSDQQKQEDEKARFFT